MKKIPIGFIISRDFLLSLNITNKEMSIKINAIAAKNYFGFIGKDGKLMWKSSADFSHFKEKTRGGICIVGERTYEIDLKGKGLPGRKMVVIGDSNKGYVNCSVALQTALDLAKELNKDEIWIIGGQSIYEQFMSFIDVFHLSLIKDYQIGDTSLSIPDKFRGEVKLYEFDVDEIIEKENVSSNSK